MLVGMLWGALPAAIPDAEGRSVLYISPFGMIYLNLASSRTHDRFNLPMPVPFRANSPGRPLASFVENPRGVVMEGRPVRCLIRPVRCTAGDLDTERLFGLLDLAGVGHGCESGTGVLDRDGGSMLCEGPLEGSLSFQEP